MKEFNKLKNELRRKREIPKWFKARFKLDYDHELPSELVREVSSTSPVEKESEMGVSPRVRAAKRKLEEIIEEGKHGFVVKVKKLKKSRMKRYKKKMDKYNRMLDEETARIEEKKLEISQKLLTEKNCGKKAAKGVGFKGAIDQELLEQKAKVICKANKKHRFKACLKCTGCRTENCGQCVHCLDMPKFGGLGTIKQKCIRRICVNPQLRTCGHCVWNL